MKKDILEDCIQAIIDSSHGTNNVKTDSLPGLMIKNVYCYENRC